MLEFLKILHAVEPFPVLPINSTIMQFYCKCGVVGSKVLGHAKVSFRKYGFAYQCRACLKKKIASGKAVHYTEDFLRSASVSDPTARSIQAHEIVEFKCSCGVLGTRQWCDAQKTFKKYGFYHQCSSCLKAKYKDRSNNSEWLAKIRAAAQTEVHKARARRNGKCRIIYTPEQIEAVILASGARYEGDLSTPSNTIRVFWPNGTEKNIRIRRFMCEGLISPPKIGELNPNRLRHQKDLEEYGVSVELLGNTRARLTYRGESWERDWHNHVDARCRKRIRKIDLAHKFDELVASGLAWSTACKRLGLPPCTYLRRKNAGMDPKEAALSIKTFERTLQLPGAIYNTQLDGTNIRPDIYLPESKLIIEIDGMKWHNEDILDKKYHIERYGIYRSAGLDFLSFSSYEIEQKREIVDSMVANRLGKCLYRVGARKCAVVCLFTSAANEFFGNNHLKGPGSGKCLALIFGDKVVAALRYVRGDRCIEINRFACRNGWSVAGAYSRLLAQLPSGVTIWNYIDHRHGSGSHLLNKGFILYKQHQGFEWTDGYHHWNRRQFLGNSGYDAGLVKFWDYGQSLYVRYG